MFEACILFACLIVLFFIDTGAELRETSLFCRTLLKCFPTRTTFPPQGDLRLLFMKILKLSNTKQPNL